MAEIPQNITISTLEAQGFTYLEARCCNITCIPFRMLKEQRKIGDGTTYAELAGRLRCSGCGRPPEPRNIRPWFQYIDRQPDPAGPAKTWGKPPPTGRVRT